MRTVLSAIVAAGLLVGATGTSAAATHRKHKRKPAATATRSRTSSRGMSNAGEGNLGTKGFPPKPLPAADPRNPADPQKASVNGKVPSPDAPVKPPDPTNPTKTGR